MKLRFSIVVACFLLFLNAVFAFQKTLLSPEGLQIEIQKVLDSLYDETEDFAGATIGVVLPQGEKLGFALGMADVEKKVKMKPTDMMLGGSTGKVFVSASIMQLIEKGALGLDDKVIKHLGNYDWYKGIQNFDKLTIRHLLQHASGISRYVFEPQFQQDINIDADRTWKPQELLSYVLNKDPLFEAGTSFAYSDTNYILLGLIIEEITKMSMYEYIDKNILKPSNLKNVIPQTKRKIDGLVVGYNKMDDPFYPGVVLDNGQYKYNVQFEWAGGGFAVNAADLAHAGKLIYENKLFDNSLMKDFLEGIDAKQLGGTWGLGVHIKNTPIGTSYGHSGFFPGYVTNMLYFPKDKFAIAFQVNTSDNQKLSLYRKLFRLIPEISKLLNSN